MKRQRNMQQMRKHGFKKKKKKTRKSKSKGNSHSTEKEFRVMIVSNIQNFGNKMEKQINKLRR